MAGKIVAQVTEVAKPIINDLGYVLVDVEYKKTFNGMEMNVLIDNDTGITLDDCEKVSKALDEPLDKLDPTNGESYTFNVSSMGLDRPLKTDYQFNKYMGSMVEIHFYVPFENHKTIQATLLSHSPVEIMVEYNNQKISLSKEKISLITPVIKF